VVAGMPLTAPFTVAVLKWGCGDGARRRVTDHSGGMVAREGNSWCSERRRRSSAADREVGPTGGKEASSWRGTFSRI